MAGKNIDVHSPDGSKAGSVVLPAALFDVDANIALMHQVVTAQLAAARQGSRVQMIGCVGQDRFAEGLLESLRSAHVNIGGIREASGSSGVALIGIEPDGQGSIVVVPGANRAVSHHHIEHERRRIAESQYLLLQLEIPIEANIAAAKLAKQLGTKVILTPSPIPNFALPRELLDNVDIIVPNRGEAVALTGADTPHDAARALRHSGDTLHVGLEDVVNQVGLLLADGINRK